MAEVPAEDLQNFDISLLDEHLYPNDETSNDATSKVFENVIINQDVSLGLNWMNNYVNFGQNNDKLTNNRFFNESDYSDTESQAGGSSAIPSPALVVDHNNRSFMFLQDHELTKVSVRELNKLVKNLPKAEVDKIKKRRRTLKNRRYAHSCRMKRLDEKSTLETTKVDLEKANDELQRRLEIVTKERDGFKQEFLTLVKQMQMVTQRK